MNTAARMGILRTMKKKRLYRATNEGNADEIRLLIKKGVRVNTKSFLDGVTPLHIAARRGGIEVAELLMQSGADVNAAEKSSESPLHWGAERGHAGVVKTLLDNGADPDARAGAYGESPLHRAAWAGHSETARVLLDSGAGVNMKNWNGETPLHWACMGKGHARTVKLLIEKGAGISARTAELAETPLHLASRFDRFHAAEVLVKKGADITAEDKDGKTPPGTAKKYGSERTAAFLAREAG